MAGTGEGSGRTRAAHEARRVAGVQPSARREGERGAESRAKRTRPNSLAGWRQNHKRQESPELVSQVLLHPRPLPRSARWQRALARFRVAPRSIGLFHPVGEALRRVRGPAGCLARVRHGMVAGQRLRRAPALCILSWLPPARGARASPPPPASGRRCWDRSELNWLLTPLFPWCATSSHLFKPSSGRKWGARLLKPLFTQGMPQNGGVFAHRLSVMHQEVLRCLPIRRRLYCL